MLSIKKLIKQKALIFPAIITGVLIILTVLGINGSSIGIYDSILGKQSDNSVIGEPRGVRSDEWLVNTPLIISQINNNYPTQNDDVGGGHDTSVVVDVPYFDWSSLFRPQNLSFFIMPPENAFAFKWWLLSWILLISIYIFSLKLLPKKYLAASLLSILFLLNPFIQWWYQSITILSISYALLIVTMMVNLLEATSRKRQLLYGILASYLFVCFALLMYPAFQIGAVLFAVSVFAGIYLGRYKIKELWSKRLALRLLWPLGLSLIPIAAFLMQHRTVISTIRDTVYPGERFITAGGMNFIELITWPFNYLLRTSPSVFGSNQSEDSRFLLFGFLLIPFLAFYFLKNRQTKSTKTFRYLFISIVVLTAVLLCNLFLPFGDPLYQLVGLHLVPHARLLLVLGLISLLLVILAVGLPTQKYTGKGSLFEKPALLQLAGGFVILVVFTAVLKSLYHLETVGLLEQIVICLFIAFITACLVHGRMIVRYAGLIGMVLFGAFSVFNVNPLFVGLGHLEKSTLVQTSKQKDAATSGWIAIGDNSLNGILLASNVKILSGVNTYPKNDLWKKHFPDDEAVYNRYAHINYALDDSVQKRSLTLLQADAFTVNASSCDPLFKTLNIRYAVSKIPDLNYQCLSRLDQDPTSGLFIYKFLP